MANPETGQAQLRMHVDYDRCAGHGLCESFVPGVFEVGDDGVTHLLADNLTEDLRGQLQTAVTECPTQALRLEG